MIRKIIHIDEEKCNGCGACAAACHEGAIGMVNGKARLLRDDYCDGLGDCLPACPTGAISFTMREAAAYNESAVRAAKATHSCPGSAVRMMETQKNAVKEARSSQLSTWPVQIKLAPVNAPFFDGAHLLIAADCTAYACASFHEDYMAGRVTLVGCPKLDAVDYSVKLGAIISSNDVKDILLVRMEVPCCGGLEMAVRKAVESSGKNIPVSVVTLSIRGEVL